jgi:hypothetical protein
MMNLGKLPPFGILGKCKGQAWGKQRALFCRKLVEAQEAKKGNKMRQSKTMEVED